MLPPRFVVSTVSISMMVIGAGIAFGQSYPTKPIRMVAAAAGGGVDLVARVIAQRLSVNLGQQVVVDNRGGAGGIIAGEMVAKAPPDGYTLLCYGPPIWLLPLLRSNLPYDPIKDFAPIAMVMNTPNVLVVHPSLPVKSVKELIALAKARPGQLNDAGSDTGSSAHLAMELFKSMAGVNIVRIPYKGVGPGLAALVAGEVQMMLPVITAALPHVKSGRLRALAVTSAQPSRLAPGMPTVAASGVPGYEAGGWGAVFAPAGTPAAIITRLNEEIVRVIETPDVRDRLINAGTEPVSGSPEALAATIKSEMAKWGKLIKDANIKAE